MLQLLVYKVKKEKRKKKKKQGPVKEGTQRERSGVI